MLHPRLKHVTDERRRERGCIRRPNAVVGLGQALTLRWGLLLCAAALVATTGLRGARLLAAKPDTTVVVRAVETSTLERALLVAPDGEAWTLRAVGSDEARRVRPGQVVEVAGTQVQVVEGAAGGGDEVLRVPWSVFGPARGGHRRIDFGADPLGRADGVRDRVVLPSGSEGAGWFHLVPPEQGRAFGPDDRSARLVPERAGLRLRAGAVAQDLVVGEPVLIERSADIEAEGVHLNIAWLDVQRASVLEGSDGRVLGYGEASASTDFVVRSLGERALGAPQLVLLDRAGEPVDRVVLADRSPTLVHGPRTRITGLRGQVLPPTHRDLRLEAAVREGLAEGWIELGPAGARVTIPTDGDDPRSDLGWGLSRDVVAVVDAYERAVDPVGLRLLEGVLASASTADGAGLRFDGSLQAWLPSSRPQEGAPVRFELAVSADEVVLAAALPARWRRSGEEDWRSLAPPRSGRWETWTLDAAASSTIEVQLEPPSGAAATTSLAFAVAGAPEGTFLRRDDVRVGPRAYEDWQLPGHAGPAASLWTRVQGDRWSVAGAPPASSIAPRAVFVRVPLKAVSGGQLALDLSVPGRVLRAWWNGAPREDPLLPTQAGGGEARLSLPTRRGDNLLALQIELPATGPPRQGGVVRFQADASGTLQGLDASVAQRRMRDAVRQERRRLKVQARGGAPEVIVERGVPGLPVGARWRLAPSAEVAGETVLILAEGSGPLRRNDFGDLHLGAEGLSWHNGRRLALGAARPLASEPEGVAVAGQRVGLGAKQRLRSTGETVEGPAFRLRALPPSERVLRGELVVVHRGDVHALAVENTPKWHRDPKPEEDAGAPRIAVRAAGLDVQVAVNRPAALWTHRGERVPLTSASLDGADVPVDGFQPWPRGARLVIDGLELRLRRPGKPEAHDLPPWAEALGGRSTLDPDLQDAARWALRSQLTDFDRDDTEALAGALLVMNARTGDVLACAAEERDGADPRARLTRPCWQDGGFHPGSTFKIATASAGLSSKDPAVRRMLDGDLPEGLRRAGARSSLQGATLPGVDGGDERTLRSRLRNFRGHLMPVDADLEDALRGSLNTWFGYLGLLMHRPTREGWPAAGIATRSAREAAWPVERVARAVGFGERIDLGGGEIGTGGRLPTAAAGSDAVIAARSVGQGELSATPLGIAGLVAVAASNGQAPVPRVSLDRAVESRTILGPAAARRLRDALLAVVARGTAARAFADNPHRALILGKTGSAQRIDRQGLQRTDAWFAGAVLPPEGRPGDPVVVVALLPDGGLGGTRAAEAVDQFSRDLVRARAWDRAEADGVLAQQ